MKELADAEAARAEADEEESPDTEIGPGDPPLPDESEEEAQEQDAPPDEAPDEAPAEPSSELTMEDRGKQLASAHKSFTTRIATVMQQDADNLQPCPLCWEMTQGYVWPGMPYDENRKMAVKVVLGEYGADQYEEDPSRVQCPQCKGKGMLRTHSLVPNQDALPCRGSNAQGWIFKPGEDAPPVGNGTNIWTTQPQTAAAAPVPPPDNWGRPFGHPDFGRDPALVNAGA